MTEVRFPLLFLLCLLLALCSLSYELILAQILSATLGGTLIRHSTVIGLFTLSLGFGALFYEKVLPKKTGSLEVLFRVEIALAFLGLFSPFFIIFLEPFRLHYGVPFLFDALFYLPVMAIGALSGFELPLLLSFCRDLRQEFRILAADYFGMFAGSLLIPLFLYPAFGPFVGSLWMGLLNLAGAALLLPALRRRSVSRWNLALFSTALIAVLFFLGTQQLWLEGLRKWYVFSL